MERATIGFSILWRDIFLVSENSEGGAIFST
jgi:hypothetical protein